MADCAAIAYKRNLERLAEAQKVKADEKIRARTLVEQLEIVEEDISKKYYELPTGEDEREAEVMNRLEEVVKSLRDLSEA